MERFIFYQTLMLSSMIKSIDFSCPDYSHAIIQNYLTNVYIEQDVPSIWIHVLCKRLKLKWRKPTDDYSSESTSAD